ncbi:MAG: CCA tRNA nucleotidyltransferase [Treponema sp.]|uniref:CCA tRNA nucleotidyltransferase n=1 Tax=Treponema sp. TaxID=166 RepID=UPI003FA20F15
MIQRFPVPDILKEVSTVFHTAGFSVYLVGGAVRDFLLQKEASDWDIATDARPADVMKLFRRTIPTGIEHGTVTIIYKKKHIECTTFRTEADYSDGRHPTAVAYTASIEEDLSRRDFTMNAIAISLPDGAVIDPFGGREDIRQKCIKTVGNPIDRFLEDGLRPVRAVRFAAQLSFTIDDSTLQAIPQTLHITQKISIERFREEFTKMLICEVPLPGLRLLESTGLLTLFIPELAECRGVEQGVYHHFDVLDHSFLVCNACPAGVDNLHIRLAGLFHDIGKPAVRKEAADGSCTFYLHEAVSEKLTRTIMRRLKYSNSEIEKTAHLVAQHMFHYEPAWTDAAVRRFIVRVGKENISDLFALRYADVFGLTGSYGEPSFLAEFTARIDAILQADGAYSIKDLAVNGNDLIAAGIPAGRILGLILHDLLETVLDDPAQNTREQLLRIAAALYERIKRFQ